jgi:TRAP-type C4-dicarboxylate transport system substrate-binding protein
MTVSWSRGLAWAVLLAAASTQAAAEPLKLKIADNLPPSHFLANYATHFFMDEVTKRTGGQVTFDYYPSEQLGKAGDILSLTQSGVTDIGLVTPSVVSQKMPLSSIAEQPGSFSTSCEGTLAYFALARNGFLEKNEFRPNGVRVVFAYVNPPYQLYLAKREVHKLADVSGMKIRSVAGTMEIAVKKLGAVPVRTSTTEVYEALSRGTVDGMLFPVPTVLAYDLQGLIKFSTQNENFGSVANVYVISETKWRSLPEAVKTVINEVGEAATRRACEMTDRDVATTYDKFRQLGIKQITFDEEDKRRLKELFSTVRDEWAKNLEQRGKPANAGLAAFAEALKGGPQ